MALGFTEGSTRTTASFFAIFEAFVVSIGWTVVAGSGTTNMVISSTGESGLLNKLFVHAWAPTATTMRFEVQDDAAGTHVTTDGNVQYISATLNQYYALVGDKDYIIVHTNCTIERRTHYVGLLLPIFNNPALDETYRIVSAQLDPDTQGCQLLRNAAGAWNTLQASNTNVRMYQGMGTFHPGSYMALHPCPVGTDTNLCGCYKNVSLFDHRKGIQGDYLTSVYPGNSVWMKQGRVAFLISGTPPVFNDDSPNFISNTINTNVRLDIFDLLIRPTLLANGWVETDNTPVSGFDRDSFFFNTGNDGISEITIRIWIQPAVNTYYGVVYNTPKTEWVTLWMIVAAHTGIAQNFYAFCDRDCFGLYQDGGGAWLQSFCYLGKILSYLPPAILTGANTAYASICTHPRLTTDVGLLRDIYTNNWYTAGGHVDFISSQEMDGTWAKPSSQNAFDARVKMFPILAYSYSGGSGAVKGIPYGQLKYCYNVDGAVAAGDTINASGNTYRVVAINPAGTVYYFAVREV